MNNCTDKMSFRELIQLIESHTHFQAKHTTSGYSLRCPAHDDKNPSLSISEANDGTILLKCFRGCSFNEICTTLNINPSNLFPPKSHPPIPHPSNIEQQANGKKNYPYHDEQGNLLYMKLRIPDKDGKRFEWQRLDNQGNIIRNIQGCRKVLYQLPVLLKGIQENKIVFLVEGEKDANTLLKLNQIATTAPTPQWLDEYTNTLKDADVIILYDYDKTGYEKRDKQIKALYNKTKRLRVVDLPGLQYTESHGKDITDWLEMGNAIEQLLTLIENTPDYTPSLSSGGLVVVNFEELVNLEIPKPEVLLSPFLWSQGLALLYAKRGVGKTHIALGIACAVAKGGTFLKWTAQEPKKVLYIDGEMSAYSMQNRLRKIGTTDDELKTLAHNLLFITPDLQKLAMPNLSTQEGRETLVQIIADRDLIIVDNLSSLFRSGAENEAESWMPIQEWALSLRRQGKSVLFIHHAGKNGVQRGTSKREDILDVIINLRHPNDYKAREGAFFEVHFEKTRHFSGNDADSFQAQLIINAYGQAEWIISDINADPEIVQIAEMRKEGKTFVEITHKTGLSKSQVETRLSKAKDLGMLA